MHWMDRILARAMKVREVENGVRLDRRTVI